MRRIPIITSALALIISSGLCFGQGEKVSLKPKFIAGKKYVIEQLVDQTTSVPTPQGELQKMDTKIRMVMGLAVTQLSADEKKLQLKFEEMVMDMNMAGQQIKMDAADPAQKPMLGQILDKIPVMIYSNDNKFIRMEGDSLEANPVVAKMMNEESLKQMINGSMEAMPTEPIAPGHKWEQKVGMPMEGIGNMDVVMKYHFEKMEEVDGVPCARISFEGTIAGDVKSEGVNITFEDSEMSGIMHMDPVIGYVRKQEMKNAFTMKMNVPGQEAMTIPLNQTITVKLKDFVDVE